MKKDKITAILLFCVLVLCMGIAIVLASDMGEETNEGEVGSHAHDDYVEKTGDTMTGDLIVQNLHANEVINGDGSGIWNLNASRINIGAIDSARLPSNLDADTLDGFDSTELAMATHSHDDRYHIKTESDSRYASMDHTHPPGDADTLDDYDSSDFAMAAHTHDTMYYLRSEVDANFLNLSGGAMTGDLYLPNLYAIGIINGHSGGLTDLNASRITNGTIDNARLPTNINADTLDGYDFTNFAMAAHTHDTRYYLRSEVDANLLNLGGGTLTGDLYLPNLYAIGIINGHSGGLTDLNASRITNGTIDSGRLPTNIDAETLDGFDSTNFAMAAHTHDTRYYLRSEVEANFLNLSGGSLTGDLYLPSLYASGVINGDGSGLTNLNANSIAIGTINLARLPPNIDADTLDGYDFTYFAMAAHTHDASDITGGNLIVDGLNVDSGTLYVDGTNDRVGVGTTSPNEEMEIYEDQDDWTNLRLNNPNGGTNAGSAIYFYEGGTERAYIAAANSGNTASSSGPNSLRIQTSNGPITIHSNSFDDVIIQENAGPGRVGIGTTSPTHKLHVDGDARVQMGMLIGGSLNVNGKATILGGVDPPYVSFSNESHESIRQYANDVVEHEKVMLFWNGEAYRIEVYVIGEDNFYTITGEQIAD